MVCDDDISTPFSLDSIWLGVFTLSGVLVSCVFVPDSESTKTIGSYSKSE